MRKSFSLADEPVQWASVVTSGNGDFGQRRLRATVASGNSGFRRPRKESADPPRSRYPIPVMWRNVCSGGAGSFDFGSDWQFEEFGPTDDSCATLIDLQGAGSGTVKLQYFSL